MMLNGFGHAERCRASALTATDEGERDRRSENGSCLGPVRRTKRATSYPESGCSPTQKTSPTAASLTFLTIEITG